MKTSIPICLFPLVVTGIVASAVPADRDFVSAESRNALVAAIDERLAAPEFSNTHWGVLFESLEDGEVWYAKNADRNFIPASNQKIPTAAAALLSLGPDFVYKTPLVHTGRIEGSVLDGDLVVFGTGDPTLYERFHQDSRDVFREWAGILRDMGVERITGDIIGDDSAWEGRHVGAGWPHNSLTPWYYAEYGPLQFNENYVDLRFYPPETVDGDLEIVPNVDSDYFTLVDEIEVVEEGRNSIGMNRPVLSNTITLSGTVVAGSSPFERTPTITNPTLFYVTVLKEVLEAEGIAVDGNPVDCDNIEGWSHQPDEFPRLATHVSPPLKEIVRLLMKRSQNMYAETLVLTMGWKENGFGTFAGGRSVVGEQLEPFGLDPGEFRFSDGSGLSRHNLISPAAINRINRGMWDSDLREVWLDSFPLAGADGTLGRRMRGTAMEGNVRAKTGTLSAVRALSGYLTSADGEKLLFSIIANGHLTGPRAVDSLVEAVLDQVATFETRPDTAGN